MNKLSKTEIRSPIEIDKAVVIFVNEIHSKLEEAKYKIKKRNTDFETPKEIIHVLKEKSRLRKHYQKTLDPQTKREINQVTRALKQKLENNRNKKWTQKLEKINNGDNPWKIIKNLKNEKTVIPPLNNNNGRHIITDKEKAEHFANQLEKQFSTNPSKNPNFVNHVKNQVKILLDRNDEYKQEA